MSNGELKRLGDYIRVTNIYQNLNDLSKQSLSLQIQSIIITQLQYDLIWEQKR